MIDKPVLIVGAGITGLLLAQHLRQKSIPFKIFDRHVDLDKNGDGWGLTVLWSLSALTSLLPEDILRRLPEAYVDQISLGDGPDPRCSFFDLSTGKLQDPTSHSSIAKGVRLSRHKFRRLLTTEVHINVRPSAYSRASPFQSPMDMSQWGKAVNYFDTHDDGTVTVYFDDGTSTEGSLLVACEGRDSRIRRQLFPDHENYHIPVGCVGATMYATAEEVEPLRQLDPFFLHGTASQNDTFAYFSLIEAPTNKSDNKEAIYTCQVIVSWPIREGRDSAFSSINTETNACRISLLKRFALTWAEPFRSLVLNMPKLTETTRISLSDWPPPRGLRTSGSVALVGDALHAMAMYRGEAVNHAIVDLVDFVELVLPVLTGEEGDGDVRKALDRYEDKVVERTRPAVLASRQACLEAHNWEHVKEGSPLLTKRALFDEFDEGSLCD